MIKKLKNYSLLTLALLNFKPHTLKASTLTSPSGSTPGWGVAFLWNWGLNSSPSKRSHRWFFCFRYGLGKSVKYFGGAVTLGIGSINPFDGGIGERGYFGFSCGQTYPKTNTSWAVGFNNIIGWHVLSKKIDPNFYLAITQRLFTKSKYPISITSGLGSYTYANRNSPTINDIGYFAAIGVQITPRFNLIADYTGVATSVGVSTMPLKKFPVSVNLVAWDILHRVASHNAPSFMGVIAFVYKFK